ncbi:MAG: hypothetical protein H7328_07705 [Bdellovibrio sp.]|nr:hypothetical protein [Bdellovibrio sp.]
MQHEVGVLKISSEKHTNFKKQAIRTTEYAKYRAALQKGLDEFESTKIRERIRPLAEANKKQVLENIEYLKKLKK